MILDKIEKHIGYFHDQVNHLNHVPFTVAIIHVPLIDVVELLIHSNVVHAMTCSVASIPTKKQTQQN